MRKRTSLVLGSVVMAITFWLFDAAAGSWAAEPALADALGGTWGITVSNDDTGKSYEDTLSFKPAEVRSEALSKQGYGAAAYETDTRAPQAVTFTATMEGKQGAKAKWQGTAAAGQIQGTLVVTLADGKATNYTYKGERKGR